jgi:DNA-directed RNA polymerase specialized sigma24 family protein
MRRGVLDTPGVSSAPAPSEITTLLARARSGDRTAFAALMRICAPRLAAYLGARISRPQVVERLVGDAIVAAWGRLAEADDARQFPSWFRRIGAGLALQWKSDHPGESIKEPFPESRCADPGQLARMRKLQEGLLKLAEPERMALEQRFRGALEGEALAEVLHCDAGKAQELVERALAALGRHLDA